MQDMKAAEQNGTFDYNPNYDPKIEKGIASAGQHVIGEDFMSINQPPSLIKRKNSFEDLELDIEGINLDDNLDTSVSIFF